MVSVKNFIHTHIIIMCLVTIVPVAYAVEGDHGKAMWDFKTDYACAITRIQNEQHARSPDISMSVLPNHGSSQNIDLSRDDHGEFKIENDVTKASLRVRVSLIDPGLHGMKEWKRDLNKNLNIAIFRPLADKGSVQQIIRGSELIAATSGYHRGFVSLSVPSGGINVVCYHRASL